MKRTPTSEPREGFTTGSAVTAAAVAALTALLSGECPGETDIPLPPDENGVTPEPRLTVPVTLCERLTENGGETGYAEVTKDGGDDPDATHGMLLTARVAREAFASDTPPLRLTETVTLYAGEGIGTATLPGLPVAIGEMAVNPAPRRQLAAALNETAARFGYGGPIHCLITAPEGEKRARHTLNGRLGIVGGISILGTRGTVKAFSSEAWQATICQALDVAKALGCRTVAFSTGRRSEKALCERLPELPPQAFIQVADHAGFAVREAAKREFAEILWGCFPGKLLKLAQGLAWTHARAAAPDFSLLKTFCLQNSVPERVISGALAVPTVLGALEVVHDYSPRKHAGVIQAMAKHAAASVSAMADPEGNVPRVCVYAFDMQGRLLAKGYKWHSSET
ncbi:cobalt-precorrin-5B (C(1))-methyltransferase CbiD [Desulfovibrio sp. OttesenSCG-928-O18]|nr:cobalt-precorrin-5B (C(1))-methyltransferase CbiD [Desulfovibrio sp. OttesenSCG-928-O18]